MKSVAHKIKYIEYIRLNNVKYIDCHLVTEINLSTLSHLRFGEYVLVYAIQGVKQ